MLISDIFLSQLYEMRGKIMKQIKLKAEKIIAILIVAVMLMGVAPMGELSNFAVKASAASVVDSGKCGDNVTWTLDSEGTLTVSGEGEMTTAPFSGSGKVKSVTVKSGVKSICNGAFGYCASLKNIKISDSVTSIGQSAFEGCTALKSIIVDENNKNYSSDDNGVLFDKSKKTLISYPIANTAEAYTMPSTVEKLETGAFSVNVNLKSLTFSDNIKTIDSDVFGVCFFESITLPKNLKRIERHAFIDCLSIKSVIIPEGTEYIGENAFTCNSLTDFAVLSADVEIDGSYVGCITDYYSDDIMKEVIQLYKNYYSGKIDDEKFSAEYEKIDWDRVIHYNGAANPDFTLKIHADGRKYTAETYAVENGVSYEFCHFYGEWVYDWENYVRTRKCQYCDDTQSEPLERNDTGDTEIVAPDQDGDFKTDEVKEGDGRYLLVTNAFDHHYGHMPTVVKVIDINLENQNGVNVQPDGKVLVRIPHQWRHENYKVYRVNDDGTLTDMHAYRSGDNIVFETDHFSLYVIVDESDSSADSDNSGLSFAQLIKNIVAQFKELIDGIIEFFRSFGDLS